MPALEFILKNKEYLEERKGRRKNEEVWLLKFIH